MNQKRITPTPLAETQEIQMRSGIDSKSCLKRGRLRKKRESKVSPTIDSSPSPSHLTCPSSCFFYLWPSRLWQPPLTGSGQPGHPEEQTPSPPGFPSHFAPLPPGRRHPFHPRAAWLGPCARSRSIGEGWKPPPAAAPQGREPGGRPSPPARSRWPQQPRPRLTHLQPAGGRAHAEGRGGMSAEKRPRGKRS